MRLRWMLGLVSALLLTAIFAIPAPASAFHQGTVSSVSLTVSENNLAIPFNNYTGYTFFLGATDQIAYVIQVITPSTGQNVDVYFFSSVGLASYRSDPPQTSQALESHVNSAYFAGSFTGSSGSITVIIDNVNGTGATPTGAVTMQVGMSKNSGTPSGDTFSGILAIGLAICIGIILVIVFVIVLIVYLITRANRPAMPPPMPPYMPPPQQPWPPPQQPPQGGNPPGQWPPGNP